MRVMELSGGWGLENIRLGTRPDPRPGPGQVLVRMGAASVNYRDRVVLERGYGRLSGQLPLIILSDGAGHVVETGPGVHRVAVGDLVCPIIMPGWLSGPLKQEHREALLGGPRDGVMAECMVANEADLVKAPAFYTAEQAATLPCAALTAWTALSGAGVTAGDVVATQGTGGVSLFALQFARAMGARTLVTSGSPEKLARAQALGADFAIDYRATPEWARALRELVPAGADLVIEVGGSETLAQSLRAVRIGGTVALIGRGPRSRPRGDAKHPPARRDPGLARRLRGDGARDRSASSAAGDRRAALCFRGGRRRRRGDRRGPAFRQDLHQLLSLRQERVRAPQQAASVLV